MYIFMIWFLIVGLLLSVTVLIVSSKWVVQSASSIARSVKISEFIISFVLIALATTLAELSIGIQSALQGVPELSFGDVVGTNIANLTLVLGLVAIIAGSVTLQDYEHFKHHRSFQFLILTAPFILLLDGELSRFDGIVLLMLAGWNLLQVFDKDEHIMKRKVMRTHLHHHAHVVPEISSRLWHSFTVLLLGVMAVLSATYMLIYFAKEIALIAGVSKVLIGILIVAVCTSMPEIIVGIRSALTKHGGVALGDVMGATALNASLVLGLVAVIHPITISDTSFIVVALGTTVAALVLLYIFLHSKHQLSRTEGIMMLLFYLVFVAVQIVFFA